MYLTQVSGFAEVICLLVIKAVGEIMKRSGCDNFLTVGDALKKRKGKTFPFTGCPGSTSVCAFKQSSAI